MLPVNQQAGQQKIIIFFYFWYFHSRKLIIFHSATDELKNTGPTLCTRGSQINVALVYKPKLGGCGVSANKYSCAKEAQMNFGDLTPYLTYALYPWRQVEIISVKL
jgi:hypothetical protein